MVDTSIIMQAARTPSVDLPGILQRSAESAAAIERLPLLKKQDELSVQAQEQKIQQQMSQEQAQKSLLNANAVYGYAKQLRDIPIAQRRTFLSSIPDDVLNGLGIDSSKLQSMAIDDASIDTTLMQLEPIIRQNQAETSDPAELQTFKSLTEGLSEEEQQEARRIKLGLGSRRKGVRQIDIGGVPHVLDLDTGKAVPLDVDGESVSAERISDTQSKIKGAVTRSVEQAKDTEEFISEAVPKLSAIRSNIGTYDEVIDAIDRGASTGFVDSLLPSINDASIDLDNLRIRLGLDVVSMGSFGALSESEMQIALSSALPNTKEPEALRKWVENKRSAQIKASEALEDAVDFLNQGNSLADLVAESRRKNKQGGKEKEEKAEPKTQGFKFIGFE